MKNEEYKEIQQAMENAYLNYCKMIRKEDDIMAKMFAKLHNSYRAALPANMRMGHLVLTIGMEK